MDIIEEEVVVEGEGEEEEGEEGDEEKKLEEGNDGLMVNIAIIDYPM